MRLDLTPLDDAIAQLEEAIEYHGSDPVSRDPALKLHLRRRDSGVRVHLRPLPLHRITGPVTVEPQ